MGAKKTRHEETDNDSPWKIGIKRFFEQVMVFFFPKAHAEIDWSKGFEFLDKELQKMTRESEVGRGTADLLVKVHLKSGEATWILVHIEIQAQRDVTVESRMYLYNCRFYERHKVPIASFLILADPERNWRPSEFRYNALGCEQCLKFNTAKVLDLRNRWNVLEASSNPIAVLVMAHLNAQETMRDEKSRCTYKAQLMRHLVRNKHFERKAHDDLMTLIDCLMPLPDNLERKVDAAMSKEKKVMRFKTHWERWGEARGEARGEAKAAKAEKRLRAEFRTTMREKLREKLRENSDDVSVRTARDFVLGILRDRFARVPVVVSKEIASIDDLDRLKELRKLAATSPSLKEVFCELKGVK